ncbi:MAG TPA: uridine diphosphate-N-acetylglucosamine-binding protein YvcK [Acidimicrobiia bacterium]|nr:uridine diphosphate-N-acetylglucosamine-binding protein YvcK [Acidimicrobiia bacterium]
MSETDLLVDPLLEELENDLAGVRVTALGGGHGLAGALKAVLGYAGDVTAIVTVADDGGSSGRLSPALAIPPPGDIRMALLALSPEGTTWRDLMEYRFEESDVAGHSLGNLIIAALANLTGSFEDALDRVARLLGARGTVLPAAPVPLVLEADVDDRVVSGQVAIARSRGTITDVRLVPADVPAGARVTGAIAAADQIVLGPGSLFTSIIAGLRVPGIAEAVNAAGGRLVYVCNLTTQDGETLAMSGDDHLDALTGIGGIRSPDAIVVHDGPLEVPQGLTRVTFEDSPAVVRADVVDPTAEWPQHDPARLGAVLRRLT